MFLRWFNCTGSPGDTTRIVSSHIYIFFYSYVGNLEPTCTEELIYSIFSRISPVLRCKMIYSVCISWLMFDMTSTQITKCRLQCCVIILVWKYLWTIAQIYFILSSHTYYSIQYWLAVTLIESFVKFDVVQSTCRRSANLGKFWPANHWKTPFVFWQNKTFNVN